MNSVLMVELAYLATGLLLPLFYLPQIIRLATDTTLVSSYSLCKAAWQFTLRLPALIFAVVVVQSGFMIVVLSMDIIGRVVEILTAIHALRRQGVPWAGIYSRVFR